MTNEPSIPRCAPAPNGMTWAGQQFVAVLLGPDDPVVRDALQGQVLAAGGAPGRLALGFVRLLFREVDPYPSWIVVRQRGVPGKVVLPRGSRVERLRRQFVGADAADPVQSGDACLVQDLGELLAERGGDAVLLTGRRQVEEACPDTRERCLVCQVVSAVDAQALDVVEIVGVAAEVLGGQEDGRLDARDGFSDVELLRGPFELAPEFLRLLVGEVQRVLDRPRSAAVAENPGRAVVGS